MGSDDWIGYFADTIVFSGLVIAIFLASLFFLNQITIILVLLVITFVIGYARGFYHGSKKEDKYKLILDLESKLFRKIILNDKVIQFEYDNTYKQFLNTEKLIIERTNVFILAYTFLFATFIPMLIIRNDNNSFIIQSLTNDSLIYIEFMITAFAIAICLIHFVLISDAVNYNKHLKDMLYNYDKNMNLDFIRKIDRPFNHWIGYAYRVIPLIVFMLWMLIGTMMISSFAKVKWNFGWVESTSECFVIFLIIAIIIMLIPSIKLYDDLLYRKKE